MPDPPVTYPLAAPTATLWGPEIIDVPDGIKKWNKIQPGEPEPDCCNTTEHREA